MVPVVSAGRTRASRGGTGTGAESRVLGGGAHGGHSGGGHARARSAEWDEGTTGWLSILENSFSAEFSRASWLAGFVPVGWRSAEIGEHRDPGEGADGIARRG